MANTYFLDLSYLQSLSPRDSMDKLIQEDYHVLFDWLRNFGTMTHQLSERYNEDVISSIFQKIEEEWDELYRKEKLVLFPFISQLLLEDRLAESCKPFKNVKQHHTHILTFIQNIYAAFHALMEENPQDNTLTEAKYLLKNIEENMIQLQIQKDKYLFSKFKSCTGCRAMHEFS